MSIARDEAHEPQRYRSAFDLFLRTGRRFRHEAGPAVEVKFNPWHDPDDGQFTFAGQGNRHGQVEGGTQGANVDGSRSGGDKRDTPQTDRSLQDRSWGSGGFTGGGGGSGGGGGATGDGYWLNAKEIAELRRKHPGHEPTMAGRGETWESVAKRTHSTSAVLLKANGKAAGAILKPGDVVLVPKPAAPSKSVGSDRNQPSLVHRPGNTPVRSSKPASAAPQRHIIKNGYDFTLDAENRTISAVGLLTLGNPAAARNKTAQRQAGGVDRELTDEGGHLIAHRFNGPTGAFNHFAQDRNFNRSAYAQLENQLNKAKRAGNKVFVDIKAQYQGTSRRPSEISVTYYIGSVKFIKNFPNMPGARK